MIGAGVCKCGVVKTPQNCHKNKARRGGLDWLCMACSAMKNKLRAPRRRAQDLMRQYGITVAQYDAALEAQDFGCFICGTKTPGGKGGKYYHVDHCHDTGEVRCLLCHHCNTGLGAFKDNPDLLIKAAEYLIETGK